MPNKTACSSAVGRRKRTLPFCIPPKRKKLVSGCPANSANPAIGNKLGGRTDVSYSVIADAFVSQQRYQVLLQGAKAAFDFAFALGCALHPMRTRPDSASR